MTNGPIKKSTSHKIIDTPKKKPAKKSSLYDPALEMSAPLRKLKKKDMEKIWDKNAPMSSRKK